MYSHKTVFRRKRFCICFILSFLMICNVLFHDDLPVYAEEKPTQITADGLSDDWLYIKPIYTGDGDIDKVSAFTDDSCLYIKFELSSSANFDTWHIYLNTDGDTTNHLYFKGADYIVENDCLYRYTGDTGEWEGMESVKADTKAVRSDDSKLVEVSIPLEAIGNPESIGINLATVANWADVATSPKTANEYYDVPSYDEVVCDKIVDLTESELNNYEASKRFTGEPSQWDAIDYDAVNLNSNLKCLKAVSDGSYLYIHTEAKHLSNNFTIYIKTEEECKGTDMTEYWKDAQDCGFQLKADGKVYKMNGTKRVDMGTTLTEYYINDNGMEAKIPFEMLETTGTSFKVAMVDQGEILPDAGKEMLCAESPILEDAPAITVDGLADDWKGMESIGKGTGTLGDLYAFRDNDNLYVMTYISGVTDPESSAAYTTSLFIDSDQDTETGYQHSEYPLHSGGNFLIQDWYSCGDQRNLEIFHTEDKVTLPWNMSGVEAEGYQKVFHETDTAGVYCAEWVVPISTLTGVVPEVSDTLYIGIDREDCQTDATTFERMTPRGFTPLNGKETSSFAKVPKYQITFALDFKDSGFSDWDGICNTAVHRNVSNLYAVRSEDKLFTMALADEILTTDIDYYIQTDEAGFTYAGYEGISYVITGGRLYAVADNDTLSEQSEAVYQYYSDSYCLMQLYLSKLGNPGTIKIACNVGQGKLRLPSEGMLATKKVVNIEKDANLYYPEEDFEAYNNPYKGWAAWADTCEGDLKTVATDYDLVFVDIKWSELEPVKGEYAFDAIEKQYQFDYWKSRGYKMVLRFVMDNPSIDASGDPDVKRMDIPSWLYDELLAENAEGAGAGVYYTGQSIYEMLGGVGFSPNYKSKLLFDYHDKVIKALAERYYDPAITAYVEVGSLGHWAEFHCWPTGTGDFPDPELAQKYMNSYQTYFKNVKIGIRKPYALAAENNWGLYNDIFGVTSDGGTLSFLEWAESGNTDMPGSTEEDVSGSCMPEWWKSNYSGGEFANGDFRGNASDESICAVLEQIRSSHTTWLGPCSACDLKIDDKDVNDYDTNITAMLKTMGYRYNVESISHQETMTAGKDAELDMVWNNSGVAPMYYKWPVELALLDSTGAVAYSQIMESDITTMMSGRTCVTETLSVPQTLPEGKYSLTVAILNPDTNEPGISLAMENRLDDGRYKLYDVSIIKEATEVKQPVKDDAPKETVAQKNDRMPYILIVLGSILIIAIIIVVCIKRKRKNVQTNDH